MSRARSHLGVGTRIEQLACRLASAFWPLVEPGRASPAERPARWAPASRIRPAIRSRPPLGWPRQTDSLCPRCVQELRASIESGRQDPRVLVDGNPGMIPASIVERDGQVVMEKTCPTHGDFADVLCPDPAFLARIEGLSFGRDFERVDPFPSHGQSSLKYGRGAVLTIDLTNRCNLRCASCFMDARTAAAGDELNWEDIQRILDSSLEVKPKRQLSVQFSGGEPTLSPHFLEAVRYARKLGYFCVQCASNGLRFAQDPEFCREAKLAGLRLCYLQFDGVTDEAYASRGAQNLFETKREAVENLARAGIDVVLVVTVVRGRNEGQIGRIIRFAVDHADKITVVSFQPLSFCGRAETTDEDERRRLRYTLGDLARDVHDQLGATAPLRDWFPLSAMGPFSDTVDLLIGPGADFGALKCSCHPHCGIGTVLLVHKATKRMVPVCDFMRLDALIRDVQSIADAGHGRRLTQAYLALALMRSFDPSRTPRGYGLVQLLRQLSSQIGATGKRIGETEGDSSGFEWRFLFVAGMHFQDLWNYDFRRTEMCIIPYGTRAGEISFCAYNTGVGWRKVVERMQRATPLVPAPPA